MKKILFLLPFFSYSAVAAATVFKCEDQDVEINYTVIVDGENLYFKNTDQAVSVKAARPIANTEPLNKAVFSVKYDESVNRVFTIDKRMTEGETGKMTSVHNFENLGEQYETSYSCSAVGAQG